MENWIEFVTPRNEPSVGERRIKLPAIADAAARQVAKATNRRKAAREIM
jgi:hypothetical protein